MADSDLSVASIMEAILIVEPSDAVMPYTLDSFDLLALV